MALKRGSNSNLWKDLFNFNVIVILTGLLYLILLATSEPVCYTHVSLDERNRYMKKVDCDGSDKICHRFESSEDITLGALSDSRCSYSEDLGLKQAITCSTTNLPTVTEGSFNCALNTDVSKGEACTLTCNDGFYPAYSNQTVCEAGPRDREGEWSKESFVCRAITCSTTNLPIVTEGYFDCAPNSNVSKGNACNLTCNDGFYPPYSNKTVCEEGPANQGGVWSKEDILCQSRQCVGWNEWNGSEYKFISKLVPWGQGLQLCEIDNSHLITIETEEENEFVVKLTNLCIHHPDSTSWWAKIGLNDLDNDGTWEWSDGTVSSYRNWSPGRPSESPGKCGQMFKGLKKWYTYYCGLYTRTICERNNTLT